jgi:hypothetical protein
MQQRQQQQQQNEPPPHVLARRQALQHACSVLGECRGVAPAVDPARYRTNYLDAVKTECHREIFGMLDTFWDNNPDAWLSINEVTLRTHEDGIDKETARQLDNNLVVVVGCMDRDPFVGMLHHASNSDKQLAVLRWGGDCSLSGVLGPGHALIDQIDRTYARPDKAGCYAVVVGYVGDALAALTSAHLPSIGNNRGPNRDDLLPAGYHSPLLQALSTGQRAQVEWRQLDAERLQHLNPSQFQALDGMTRNLELVRGPPGTGKSTLIDAFVKESVGGDTAVCVTAVQNRACEALAIKFARSGTPFIAVGTRLSPATEPWTLERQVARDAAVVEAEAACVARRALLQRVRARIATRTARFYRPYSPTEDSDRQSARERRARQLVANPNDAIRSTQPYRDWEERHSTVGSRQTPAARRDLAGIVDAHMKALDPWRRAAEAIARARMPEAHAFRDAAKAALDAADYALDRARAAAAETITGTARALLCTTATVGVALRRDAAVLAPLIRRLHALVCDEAGTLADRHILPVIGAAPVQRLVLVGDPAQLTCFSTMSRAPGAPAPVSAMARIINAGVPAAMLTTQYRMPSSLCSVVSGCFYGGALETARRRVADVATPLVFLGAEAGVAEIPSRSGKGSVLNREEARVAVREIERIRLKHGADAEIAVLATYAAQRNLVQDALERKGGYDSVVCITVDAAQGQEWDFVVYTHVASDPQKLGFTKSPNRLCVALSRAKRQMTVIAHPKAVERIAPLKAFRAAAFRDSEEVRRILQGRAGGGAVRALDGYKVCCVCYDPIGRSVGFLECGAPDTNNTHAMCPSCADGHVLASVEAEGFNGKLHCPCAPDAAGACLAPPYNAAEVARVVTEATFETYNRATVQLEERRVARILEEDMEERLRKLIDELALAGGAGGAADAPEQRAINEAAAHLIEKVLTLRCPHCQLAFVDFDACAALRCRCGQRFCALCLEPADSDEANHVHVAGCAWNPHRGRGDAGVFVTADEFEQAHRARQAVLIDEHLVDAFEIGSPQAEAVRAAILPHLM